MQVDVKLGVVPRADQHAEDQQPVHLEQQLDFQVVLLYQARPHVQRDILLAVFLEPQGTLLDAREWAKSHFTWWYACSLARLLRRAGLCCRRLCFFLSPEIATIGLTPLLSSAPLGAFITFC